MVIIHWLGYLKQLKIEANNFGFQRVCMVNAHSIII